eukprot:2761451-Pyramimonas_sp.AAC.1
MMRFARRPPVTEETDSMFEHLATTLIQQGHLCPLPISIQPIYWEYDYALRLQYPNLALVRGSFRIDHGNPVIEQLITAIHEIVQLVLADFTEQASFAYKDADCNCFNPFPMLHSMKCVERFGLALVTRNIQKSRQFCNASFHKQELPLLWGIALVNVTTLQRYSHSINTCTWRRALRQIMIPLRDGMSSFPLCGVDSSVKLQWGIRRISPRRARSRDVLSVEAQPAWWTSRLVKVLDRRNDQYLE